MAPDGAADQEKTTMEASKSSATNETDTPKDVVRVENLPLNIGQLKELLDEAFNYKNPKDREGKSKVFLDLLLEAESAEEAEGQELAAGGRRPLRGRASERSGAGGSLQNICQAVESDSQHHPGGRRKNRHSKGPGNSVSARQREGGSLPCNVNAGWTADWQSEGVKRRDLSSMSCEGSALQRGGAVASTSGTQARRQNFHHSASNELPNSGNSSSSSTDRPSCELPAYRVYVLQDDSVTLRQGVLSTDVPDGRRMNEERAERLERLERRHDQTQDDQVSSTTGPNLYCYENTLEPEGENNNGVYRTSASLEVGDGFDDGIPVVGELTPVELCDGYSSVQSVVGENSRASEYSGRFTEIASARRAPTKHNLPCSSGSHQDKRDEEAGPSGKSSKKSNKRKLAAERNVALSCKSEEMPGYRGDTDIDTVLSFIENDGKEKAMSLKKQFPKQKSQEKKQKNLQKASSLEELSQRNIEDLTQSPETERADSRHSWAEPVLVRSESQYDISSRVGEQPPYDEDQSDFQMVRKKQRRRRGDDERGKRVRRRDSTYRSPRRKSTSSVPPSERSADSDLDSVHSLPTHGAQEHASDSDCDNNGQAHLDTSYATTLTTKDFPSLPSKPQPIKTTLIRQNARVIEPKVKTRSKSVGPNMRPPVILMDSRAQIDAPCEFTFGFEVNMNLLSLNDTLSDKNVPPQNSHSSTGKLPEALPKKPTDSEEKLVSASAPNRKSSFEVPPRGPQKVYTNQNNSSNNSLKSEDLPPGKKKPAWRQVQPRTQPPISQPPPAPVDARKSASSPWKSCETLDSKRPTTPTPKPTQLPVRPGAPSQRTPAGAKPPQNSRPNPTGPVPNRDPPRQEIQKPVSPIPSSNLPKRFGTYIVTNYSFRGVNQEPTAKPAQAASCKNDETPKAFNETGKVDVSETGTVSTPVRSVSDVMTSTDDLEAVTAAQGPPNANKSDPEPEKSEPVEISDEGDREEEDYAEDDEEQNPYYPYNNENHYQVVQFLRQRWQEMLDDPNTVYFVPRQ